MLGVAVANIIMGVLAVVLVVIIVLINLHW